MHLADELRVTRDLELPIVADHPPLVSETFELSERNT